MMMMNVHDTVECGYCDSVVVNEVVDGHHILFKVYTIFMMFADINCYY